MHAIIVSVGQKMPPWCQMACNEYLKRLQHFLTCTLIEIPVSNTLEEGRKILEKIPTQYTAVILEVEGKSYSTETLSEQLSRWKIAAKPLAFVIGGPDGLSPDCKARANVCWSLSPLTLPHALARVVVCEQLYRAGSVLANHPYHRPTLPR